MDIGSMFEAGRDRADAALLPASAVVGSAESDISPFARVPERGPTEGVTMAARADRVEARLRLGSTPNVR